MKGYQGKMIFMACLVFLLISSCSSSSKKQTEQLISAAELFADTSLVPHDTIPGTDKALLLTGSGLYSYKGKLFSGVIAAANEGSHSFTSVLNGQKHGIYRSYYAGGSPFEIRQYKNNMATGRHYGYWENGHLKFDFLYFNEKKIGYFKKWYSDGKPYLFANYKDDREDGLQQGWRPNGKLFLNYVAKDGRTYGLQETALCYTLLDEQLKK